MFVPGNNPGMMSDAFIYGPDSIMLDLEDSVTMAEKDAARLLVYNALKTIDYGKTEMVVRINPLNTPYGKKDIEAVVKAGVDVIRMPKTETAEEVIEVEREIEKVEQELGCVGRTIQYTQTSTTWRHSARKWSLSISWASTASLLSTRVR